ncbi:MAG: hypothetical protein M3O28_11650 [Actinomycetota bacterium]|nr:hypothetical protein [Actinomycetota bacterium]
MSGLAEIASTGFGTLLRPLTLGGPVAPVAGAAYRITVGPLGAVSPPDATIWPDNTGTGTPLTQPLTTRADGTPPGFIALGTYVGVYTIPGQAPGVPHQLDLAGPQGPPGIPGSPSPAGTPRGVYNAGTTYALGDHVFDRGQWFSSLIGANTGNPTTDLTKWAPLPTVASVAQGARVIRQTFGVRDQATGLSVITGAGALSVTQVMSVDDPSLTAERGSVAQNIENIANPPLVESTATTFTSSTVTFGAGVDLTGVQPGMIVDVAPLVGATYAGNPSGFVASVSGQTVTLTALGWRSSGSAAATPANSSNCTINLTNSTWSEAMYAYKSASTVLAGAVTFPQGTVQVGSTAGFSASGGRVILGAATVNGAPTNVFAYTALTATTFTGCTVVSGCVGTFGIGTKVGHPRVFAVRALGSELGLASDQDDSTAGLAFGSGTHGYTVVDVGQGSTSAFWARGLGLMGYGHVAAGQKEAGFVYHSQADSPGGLHTRVAFWDGSSGSERSFRAQRDAPPVAGGTVYQRQVAFAACTTTDADDRMYIDGYGVIWGGDGTAVPDTSLKRAPAGGWIVGGGPMIADHQTLNASVTSTRTGGAASGLPAAPVKYLALRDETGARVYVPAYS